MSRNHRNDRQNEIRMELKYCEHCGGLWVREGGAGVYCGKCEQKVAELPVPKKPQRLELPRGERTVMEDARIANPMGDLEAVGGVA